MLRLISKNVSLIAILNLLSLNPLDIIRGEAMDGKTEVSPETKKIEHSVIGGYSIEALGGGAALVLTILGLSGLAPLLLASITCIVLGVALLFEGGMVASEYNNIMHTTGNGQLSTAELGGGLSTEVMAGGAAAVLGLLALLNIAPVILTAISAIVIGVGLMLGSGVLARLNGLKIEFSSDHETAKRVAHEAVSTTSGAQILVGIATVVLGILSLIGIVPVILTLVALLAAGSSLLLSGTAITGRMMTMFSH
jgi:hypothetical protein